MNLRTVLEPRTRKAFTTEDTEDTEKKKIGVKRWTTIREPVPKTFTSPDHQPLKPSEPNTFSRFFLSSVF
jgi:hypothetical protein